MTTKSSPGRRFAWTEASYSPVAGFTIERIRDYWEGRGAVFMHHGCEAEPSRMPLDQLLERADIVFYPFACISPEAALRLKAFCKRIDKPLVPLHNAGMSGLRRALESWCPLT